MRVYMYMYICVDRYILANIVRKHDGCIAVKSKFELQCVWGCTYKQTRAEKRVLYFYVCVCVRARARACVCVCVYSPP